MTAKELDKKSASRGVSRTNVALIVCCAIFITALLSSLIVGLLVWQYGPSGKNNKDLLIPISRATRTTAAVSTRSTQPTVTVAPPLTRRAQALVGGARYLNKLRDPLNGWQYSGSADVIITQRLIDSDWCCDSASSQLSVALMNMDLLRARAADELETASWFGGRIAKFIVALVAACQNPRDVYGLDALVLLRNHVGQYPRLFFNNMFAYSWAILAYCSSGITPPSEELLRPVYTTNITSTGAASMVSIALSCYGNALPERARMLKNSLRDVIIRGQNSEGHFGDIYTSGLAYQALQTFDAVIPNRTLLQEYLLEAQNDDGEYVNYLAATQILPGIAGLSYADVRNRSNCAGSLAPGVTIVLDVAVTLTLENHLHNRSDDVTLQLNVLVNSTLTEALNVAGEQNPLFVPTVASNGLLSALGNVVGSTTLRTYWAIIKHPSTPALVGVNEIILKDGDHYVLRLTSY